ncbi:hypothetical protein L1887_20429 [Cichorium endivia]|nr:hypothetical protein L1887_20429 [Cichorium endivia]
MVSRVETDVEYYPNIETTRARNLKNHLLEDNDRKDLTQEDQDGLGLIEDLIQKHFQWKKPPVSYAAFHMVMYDLISVTASLWGPQVHDELQEASITVI